MKEKNVKIKGIRKAVSDYMDGIENYPTNTALVYDRENDSIEVIGYNNDFLDDEKRYVIVNDHPYFREFFENFDTKFCGIKFEFNMKKLKEFIIEYIV